LKLNWSNNRFPKTQVSPSHASKKVVSILFSYLKSPSIEMMNAEIPCLEPLLIESEIFVRK
jgi:hypothetical protein